MKKRMIFTISALSAIPIIASPILLSSCNTISLDNNSEKNSDQNTVFNGVVPLDYFAQTPLLTQKTGPIISYGNKITAVDWYGSPIWSLDLSDKEHQQYLPGGEYNEKRMTNFTKRVFINWALDQTNNKLWLLTNTFYKTDWNNGENKIAFPQSVVEVDSLSGRVISSTPLTSYNPPKGWNLFYQIQVLANGNVQVYAQGNGSWWMNILVNAKTKEQTFSNSKNTQWDTKIVEKFKKHQKKNQIFGKVRMLYLVPVVAGVNIAIFCDFAQNNGEITKGATSDLLLCLVDDNMNEIKITNSSSPWYDYVYVPNTSRNQTNNKDAHNFNKSIYKTLDGRVYYSAWEKFYVFYPNFVEGYGVGVYDYKLTSGKRIQSYTMDVNENVFVKFWNDTRIYKMTIVGKRPEDTNISMSTYYDIKSSKEELISSNAENFVLYNVTGYSGSIMMLSSKILIGGTDFTNEQPETNKYGIAASIVPNPNSTSAGDSLGLLNTSKSFLKASDFDIEQSILNSKIPSEISKGDISLKNGGFFTNNPTKNTDGSLKYPPFKIENIDDKLGTFQITVHLDQIPWFTTTLPSDSIPKKITRNFKTQTKINSKVSWKDQSLLSYDFKNTIPSKLSVEDIEDFDPFQASFNSQTILDSNGKVIYPKKKYSKSYEKDSEGTVTIGVKYEYVPIGVTYKSIADVKTFDDNHSYTIFKSGTKKEFYFAGSNNDATTGQSQPIDINSVPQLKALSQSSLLPSSFNANDKNSFLQFINTNKSKGYPISKMNFNVESNDSAGTLKIIASVDSNYDQNSKSFTQVFTGFNKKQNYNFNFIKNVSNINGKPFSNMLASSINEGDIISSFVEYTGFNSSDFNIDLNPNDENGSLNVTINLNKKYATSLGNVGAFNKYVATYTFNGFMNTNEYNSQYNVVFRNNDDTSLSELKKMDLITIKNELDKGTLKVGEKRYSNLNQLIKGEFISSLGNKIPKDWNNENQGITSAMHFDNQAGTLNLSITIDKSLLGGYGSNLNFVVSYSDFSKGNIKPTKDNLSFYGNDLLKTQIGEIRGMKPSEMKKWLEQNKEENTKKIIQNVTGEYVTLLNQNKFDLEIVANDTYKIISIVIKFTQKPQDKDSLSEYSTQYTLNWN